MTRGWPFDADPAHSVARFPEVVRRGWRWPGGDPVAGPTSLLCPGLVALRDEFPCQDTRVSTIWTPSGEHEPESTPSSAPGDPFGEPGDPFGEPGEPGPEEIAAIRQARAELASVPVADIVANHAVGLWELAILHLSPDPMPDGSPTRPRLAEAALAIDALASMVDTLGDRLAPHDEMLRDAVTQLRMAFVQLTDALAAFDAQVAAEVAAEAAAEAAGEAAGG